jgi:hypothetical protein
MPVCVLAAAPITCERDSRMILRSATSGRWGSEASSEWKPFVIDYGVYLERNPSISSQSLQGESAPLTNSKMALWMTESVKAERLPRGARYQHARQR